MSGRSSLVASAGQQAALRELAGSAVRGEADRARAVLLTLAGWAAPSIAEAFGVGEDTVRRWRHWFARGGMDALRSTLAPGPAAGRGERALACARELLAAPVQDRPSWTLPRLCAEIEARTGVRVSQGHLSVLLRKGASAGGDPATAWPGGRTGRRWNRAEVERVGLRLQLRRAQVEAGDIALLFGDKSEALAHPCLAHPCLAHPCLAHPCLAHAWAEQGTDLRVQAPRRNAKRLRPGQARKAALLGVLDALAREALAHTSATKRGGDFAAPPGLLDRRRGPQPGQVRKPVALVPDNGPIHTSKASRAALAARSAWPTAEWLPRHAPEPNPVENTWRDLKRHRLARQTFRSVDELDRAIHQAAANLNKERSHAHPCRNLPMAA